MPYIKKGMRPWLNRECGGDWLPQNVGELTYVLYREALLYFREVGLRYQTIAEVMGALESTKQELYRRVVAEYEDGRIAENGDIRLEDL